MYLYHFGLRELPFTLTPNTQFFLDLPSHHEALEVLTVALKTGEGFIKVTGEVGTGKTLLCRMLLNDLSNDFVTTYIPNPYLSPQELRLAFAQELGMQVSASESQHQLTQLIQHQVMTLSHQGKTVVLLVDEAQALPAESIEALRLFTNLETERSKLIQVVLFGQPELDVRLTQNELRQVKQRISFAYTLRHLNESEVYAYLNHRMRVAGFSENDLFSEKVSQVIFKASKGIPRIINVLAHKCLLLCFGENRRTITLDHVNLAVNDTESVSADEAVITTRQWLLVTAVIVIAFSLFSWSII